ncbi:MAG TPA: glucose-1-phosphate thymidylyltransferase [Fervidobacterium sp.]|nr:glucose-1-phosphate thymidylyltransferase [Fervidobacterium sp.]HOQ40086.1 glucose-1-phosphate thymidylyltransferase [Fervidobacterium sp.]HPT54580.1 glucose-1-phosphate thymidylyltransferase [Fervidobacterium sp.]HPZ17999.1 glucose-1-phosphate thymidylyltransferase [Fervidobacterium sp.]HQE48965.1 glucose-1-phosphate thymidylyltransferase [Fervidobacterium sp.]
MKAIILCAGKGTRLRPFTYTTAKHLIPVANKPVILYTIEKIKSTGITQIGMIVSRENRADFENTLGDGSKYGVEITYILQTEPKGLAHAVLMAKDFLGDEDFLMYLGDNLIMDDIRPFVEDFREKEDLSALIMLSPVNDPTRFGIAIMEGNRIIKTIEKPKEPRSNLAIIGLYLFRKDIFDGIANIKPSWRGEYEITDAIDWLIQNKGTVEGHIVYGWWKDTGKPEDLIEANHKILEDIIEDFKVEGVIEASSSIHGRVSIGEGTEVVNSAIRGPVIIGKNCTISNAYIGPYTSIGDGALIENCEIENSIVMDEVRISNLSSRIDSSLIGKKVEIYESDGKPKGFQIIAGDLSKVIVSK